MGGGGSQNFLINAAQAQLNQSLTDDAGSPTAVARALGQADVALTAVFTAELLANMYAHWLRPFARSAHNLFDLAVVALSLASLGPLDLPVSVLRMTRAVRVVRLFGRLRSFKRILGALTGSLVPVANAFVLLMLVIAICQPPLPPPTTTTHHHRHPTPPARPPTHPPTRTPHPTPLFPWGYLRIAPPPMPSTTKTPTQAALVGSCAPAQGNREIAGSNPGSAVARHDGHDGRACV